MGINKSGAVKGNQVIIYDTFEFHMMERPENGIVFKLRGHHMIA
jgi:hypothetical protein